MLILAILFGITAVNLIFDGEFGPAFVGLAIAAFCFYRYKKKKDEKAKSESTSSQPTSIPSKSKSTSSKRSSKEDEDDWEGWGSWDDEDEDEEEWGDPPVNIFPQYNGHKKLTTAEAYNTYIRRFSIAGVTFDNEDGTSRQAYLEKLYKKEDPFKGKRNLELLEYEYDGVPAFHIAINGCVLGNVPAARVKAIKSAYDRIVGVEYVRVYAAHGEYPWSASIRLQIKKK